MKKNFLRSLSFVACLVSLFAFVGCDSENDDEGGEYRVEIGVVDRAVYEAAYVLFVVRNQYSIEKAMIIFKRS